MCCYFRRSLMAFWKFSLMFYCLFSSTQLIAQQTLYLNTAFTYPLSTEKQTGFADYIIREALRRIGYKMRATQLPAERALKNANKGIDDGDMLRIAGLQGLYPNLIQVPESVMSIELMVFTKNHTNTVSKWDDLNPYSVAYITGWKILERNVSKFHEVSKVKNVEQLFTILMKDRVDIILYERWVGLGYMKSHQITGIKIHEPPLSKQLVYVYLHKKHKDIIPKLAKMIKEMKADGSYQRAYKDILEPLVIGK